MSLAKTIAQAIVAPTRVSYAKPLHVFWLLVAFCTFLLLLVLSAPPMVDAVCAHRFLPSFHSVLLENRPWLNRWAAFLKLLLEILTALAIGGAVFAQSIANSIKSILAKAESGLVGVVTTQLTTTERNVYKNLRRVQYLVSTATLTNVWRRIPRLALLSYQSYRIAVHTIPMSYWRFAAVVLPAGFPGGFYGVLAFIFLALLSAVKVVQIYLPCL